MSELPARWTGAAVATRSTDRRPQLVSLPAGLPSVETLFTFARDAELRFSTLRLRVEERTWTARGEALRTHEIVIRHPHLARVTVRDADRELPRDYEVWLSDGTNVRTYSAIHDLATTRPARRRVVGLASHGLPGASKVYRPLTALPFESLAEAMIHPAGYCQNVLGTGQVRVVGTSSVAGREAIVVEAAHPRTTQLEADRPDYRIELAVDAELGLVSRLVERIGGDVTRLAEATSVEPDVDVPDAAFELAVPATARHIY